MADAAYGKFQEYVMDDLTGVSSLKIALVSATYAYSATDEFLSAATAAIVSKSATLMNVSVDLGKIDFNSVTFSAVTGDTVTGAILYIDTGSDATSRMISYSDGTNIDGIPFTPSGANVTITVANGWVTFGS